MKLLITVQKTQIVIHSPCFLVAKSSTLICPGNFNPDRDFPQPRFKNKFQVKMKKLDQFSQSFNPE